MNAKKILISALLVAGVATTGYQYYQYLNPEPQRIPIRSDYRVKYGDTVWDIAATRVFDDEDIREYIFNLRQINGCKLDNLKPGDIIEVYRY